MVFGGYFFNMKLIKILDKNEVEKTKNLLSDLKIYYCNLPDGFYFKTLGAASYIHCNDEKNSYFEIKNKINPILKDNFQWIYNKIIQTIENEYSEKSIISDEAGLAFPGFHNFYAHDGCDLVSHPPHIDMQWTYHLDYLLNKFKNVDRENFITFTLSIKLPKSGAGLYYWDLPKDGENFSLYEAELYYKDILQLTRSIVEAERDEDCWTKDSKECDSDQYEKITKPKKLIYQEGFITLFRGFLLHQIMPYFKPYSLDEERITMQGHGIKCDGIWRLYF